MTVSVHQAVALPNDSPYASHAVPKGFPFLVVDEQSKIIEPALLYLLSTQLKRGLRHLTLHTANALAYDLRDWFDYLSHLKWMNPVNQQLENGKPWDVAGETDYITWRDTLQELISPQTNQLLASSTIARRQATVERFYAHAKKQGWYTGEFVLTKVKKGRIAESINLGQDTAASSPSSGEDVKSEFREQAEYGEPVRPLSAYEWHQLQREIGPLPSERTHDLRPSRDRLACELALGTGMRVDEIASLTEYQLQGLYKSWLVASEEQQQDGFFALYIVKTKRLKPRDVLVPGYLIPELMAYLDDERKVSIKNGEARAKRKGLKYKRPSSLFVNLPESAQHAGVPVRATSLSWAFKESCLGADITHSVEKIDIETNERYRENLSKHCFHDLRHTFSVWFYHDKKSKGDAEPWKELQVLLGHASLDVTMNTYLKIVDVDRRNAGRAQYDAKTMMGKRNA